VIFGDCLKKKKGSYGAENINFQKYQLFCNTRML